MVCRRAIPGLGKRLLKLLVAILVTFLCLFGLLFGPRFAFRLFTVVVQVWAAQRLPEPEGVYRVPLRICDHCQAACQSPEAMKDALRTVEDYDAVLDEFPGTRVAFEQKSE